MKQNKLNFQSQNLVVDWISFKSQNQYIEVDKVKIAEYFSNIGFNSFQIINSNSSRKAILENSKNKFEVGFDDSHKHWLDTTLLFTGLNGKYFYQLVQEG
jgi:capsule polysaccharide export protein KpsE/RkpR